MTTLPPRTPPVARTLPVPEALLYLAAKTKRRRLSMLEQVYLRDSGVCRLCHEPVLLQDRGDRGPSVDHIIPKSQGGATTLGNLRLAHRQCNTRRGNAPAESARGVLA